MSYMHFVITSSQAARGFKNHKKDEIQEAAASQAAATEIGVDAAGAAEEPRSTRKTFLCS